MIKQSLLFLLSLCLLFSCKEGADDTGNSNTSDTIAVKEEAPLPKKHPAEEKIAFFLSEIERFRGQEHDSLREVNTLLMEFLQTACADETLLQHPFDSFNRYAMRVLTSDDKKFRIYCWDTETGGSMHFYNAIVQYKTETGSAPYVLNDIGPDESYDCGVWYTELHTVHTKNDKRYYLPIFYGRFSGIEHANGISAYAIENSKLNDKPRIFKPTGKPLSEIYFDFTSGGSGNKVSTDNSISLSNDKQTLSIPVVDEDRIVTDKSLIYKFDGNQFVYDKSAR